MSEQILKTEEKDLMKDDLKAMINFLNQCYEVFNEPEDVPFNKEQKEVSEYFHKGIKEVRGFLLKLSGAVEG